MPLYVNWEKSVPIDLGTRGFMQVHNTFEAGVVLSQCWPEDEGPAFNRAIVVIGAAFEGSADNDSAARLAFLAAAEEAHVSVQLH